MPEYLAPGVYIEEFEIGAKPIEGVSTSTAGFLGYAQRGPLDKPTLITSYADFQRVFGGFLPANHFGKDISKIRWLAYAVQGFFENGGKRVYVTRVADRAKAKEATGFLPDMLDLDNQVKLAADASKDDDTLTLDPAQKWEAGSLILLKDDAKSEFLKVAGTSKKKTVTLDKGYAHDYSTGTEVRDVKKEGNKAKLAKDAKAGDTELSVEADFKIGDFLLVKGDSEEVAIVKNTTTKKVTLAAPLLFAHKKDADVVALELEEGVLKLVDAVKAGDTILPVDNADKLKKKDKIVIGSEYLQIADVTESEGLLIAPPLMYQHPAGCEVIKLEADIKLIASSEGTWGNDIRVTVKPSTLSATQLSKDATNTDTIYLETLNGMEPGTVLLFPGGEKVKIKEVNKVPTGNIVILDDEAKITYPKDTEVKTQEFNLMATFDDSQEIYKTLSLDSRHSRYIRKIITEKSSTLIRVVDKDNEDTPILNPVPTETGVWMLGGGVDGFPGSDADINTIYEGVDHMEPDKRTGLYTFKNVDEINIVGMPGITSKYLQSKMVIHCETEMKDRFAVMDPILKADLDEIKAQRNNFDSSYAALYYPWIYCYDPLVKDYVSMPPSGHVAGVYARTDTTRGVHKAPANEKINGVFGLEKLNGKFRIVNKGTQDILNPLGVNCIREFPGRGIRVWGARTVSSNTLWKYLSVRRLFLYIEESIEKGTQWVVFEPNDEKLWARVIQTIKQFLTGVWKDGALMGSTPEEAFFIKCDRTTMTQDDIDNGRLICVIGVAPVKPAEFVIFRIAQWQGGSAATE